MLAAPPPLLGGSSSSSQPSLAAKTVPPSPACPPPLGPALPAPPSYAASVPVVAVRCSVTLGTSKHLHTKLTHKFWHSTLARAGGWQPAPFPSVPPAPLLALVEFVSICFVPVAVLLTREAHRGAHVLGLPATCWGSVRRSGPPGARERGGAAEVHAGPERCTPRHLRNLVIL